MLKKRVLVFFVSVIMMIGNCTSVMAEDDVIFVDGLGTNITDIEESDLGETMESVQNIETETEKGSFSNSTQTTEIIIGETTDDSKNMSGEDVENPNDTVEPIQGLETETEKESDLDLMQDTEITDIEIVDENSIEIQEEGVIAPIDFSANDLLYEDFTYTLSGDDAKITGYIGGSTIVSIPKTIGTYTVTTVEANAFKSNTIIRDIYMSDTITQIGDSAFLGCTNLTNIQLSENVTSIGENAFSGCTALKSLTFPESLTRLGSFGVIAGTSISSITIPQNVSYAGDISSDYYGGALAGCESLKEVIFESGMTKIPDYICAGGSYGSICNVEKVVIPNSVTEIGSHAFSKCEKLVISSLPSRIKTVGDGAFRDCSQITSMSFPDTITEISKSAFSYCGALTNVIMNYNSTRGYTASVGESAFLGCTNLTDIQLSENVTSIGENAFSGCTALKSLTFPESLTRLGSFGVIAGTSISSITIPQNVSYAGDISSDYYGGALAGCESLKEVIFESGMTKIPDYICAGGSYGSVCNVEKVVIPKSVKSIGTHAFYMCDDLTIYGYANSYAETYATDNNIPFEAIEVNSEVSATIPENGYSTALCWGNNYRITFDKPIDADNPLGNGTVTFFDEGKNDKILEVKKEMSKGGSYFSYNEEKRALDIFIAPQDVMPSDTDIYVVLSEDVVRFEDGTCNESCNDRNFWYFRTIPTDIVTTTNVTSEILIDKYRTFFGLWKADRVRKGDDGTRGICFGMCYATAAWDEKYSTIHNIVSGNSLSKADIRDKTLGGISLLDYMQYMQIYQYTSVVQKARNTSPSLTEVYNKIYDYLNNNGSPIILGVKNSVRGGGHALLPISMEYTEEGCRVLLYDCNDPSSYCYLDMKKMLSGEWIDWEINSSSLDMYSKLYYDTIWYTPIDMTGDISIAMATGNYQEKENLLSTKMNSFTLNGSETYQGSDGNGKTLTPIITVSGDNLDQNYYLYWTDANSITLNSDNTAFKETTLCGDDREYTVSVDVPAEVSIGLKDNGDQIVAQLKKVGEISIINNRIDADLVRSFSVDGLSQSGSVTMSETENGYAIKGIESLNVTTEANGERLNVAVDGLDAEKSYQINEDEKSLTIGEDNNGDGNIDNILASTGETVEKEHKWSEWKIIKQPTVLAQGEQQRTCSICNKVEKQDIAKLKPTIKLTASSIKLKTKQSTKKIKATGLAKGDSVKSWKSSNTKIVKVNSKGKITARSKTGKATITVTLKSGLSKQITVKVQKKAVDCTKVTLNKASVSLEKGKVFTLKPTITPITCVKKVKYTSSNKKVATVTRKGKIVAKKKGKATITVMVGKKKAKCKITVE